MRKRMLRTALVAFLVGGFLAGVIYLGHLARENLREHERYTITFGDIACVPPPGMTRRDFLDEVQYLASVSRRVRLLDEDLPERLRAAFAKHPWVQRVEDVIVTPPGRVEVKSLYRTPVLVVRTQGERRVVDAEGVLLPRGAPTEGLPEYAGEARPPRGTAGTRWGDPAVEAAAAARKK